MNLRDEQRTSTRERIVEAMAELVREQQTTDVPLTAVAARAGIGERTLYRHFATKAELTEGLFGWLSRGANELPFEAGSEALVDRAASFFAAYEQQIEVLRALASTQAVGAGRALRAEARRETVRKALEAELDGVPEPRRTQAMAAVHLLTSSDAFLHAKDFWDLDAAEVAASSRWAVRALLAGIDLPDDEVGS